MSQKQSETEKRRFGSRRASAGFGAAAVAVLTLFTSVAPAAAAPTPDAGPTAGGTTVTDTMPAGVGITKAWAGYDALYLEGADGLYYASGHQRTSVTFDGKLGIGNNSSSVFSPAKVATAAGVKFSQIRGGAFSGLGLALDGRVWSWGSPGQGALGTGGFDIATTPELIPGISGVTQIDIGSGHAVALTNTGAVFVWGHGTAGQLSTGPNYQATPKQVTIAGAGTIVDVQAGATTTYARDSAGKLFAWGSNNVGQLGIGSTPNQTATPTEIPSPVIGAHFTEFSAAASGTSVFARLSNGDWYAWGGGGSGKLGIGSDTNQFTPVQMPNPAPGVTFAQIAGGSDQAIGIGTDGKVYAWGSNSYGQLGDNGATVAANLPQVVAMPAGPAGATFVAPMSDYRRQYVMRSDGTLFVWGYGGTAALGLEGNAHRTVPTPLNEIPAVLTGVQFGTANATSSSATGGSWSATTPAGLCGPVDVTMNYSIGGVAQTPVVTTGGFTAGTGVAVTTQPNSGSAIEGATFTATVAATGDSTPTVQWQSAPAAPGPWAAVSGQTAATLSVTLNETTYYRAVVANCVNSANSNAITATATAAPVTDVVVTGGFGQAGISWQPTPMATKYTATIVQGGNTFTCESSTPACVIPGLAPGSVTASVVATSPNGSSAPTTGTGAVLALADAPAAPNANQGGAIIEIRDSSDKIVTEAEPGQELFVVASGFADDSEVDAFIYSTPQHLGAGTVAAGATRFAVTVPKGLSAGSHTIVAMGLTQQGGIASAQATVQVKHPAASGRLQATGAEALWLPLGAGVALLLAGALLRRRGLKQEA